MRRQKRTQGCMIGFFTNHLSFSRMRGVASPELRVRMKSRFKRGGALRLCAYFLWSSGTSLRLCAYFLWSSGTSLRLFAYFHSCSMRQAHGRQGPPFDYALIFQRCSMRQAHGRQGPQRGCTGNHGGNRGERQECAGSAGKGIARV